MSGGRRRRGRANNRGSGPGRKNAPEPKKQNNSPPSGRGQSSRGANPSRAGDRITRNRDVREGTAYKNEIQDVDKDLSSGENDLLKGISSRPAEKKKSDSFGSLMANFFSRQRETEQDTSSTADAAKVDEDSKSLGVSTESMAKKQAKKEDPLMKPVQDTSDSSVQKKEEASVNTKDFEDSDKSFLAMMISKDKMRSQGKADKPKVDEVSKVKGDDESMAKNGAKKEEPFMKPGQKKEKVSVDTKGDFEESDKSFLAMMISKDIMSSQRKTGKPKGDEVSKSLRDSPGKRKDDTAKGSSASVAIQGEGDQSMAKKGVKKEESFMKPGQNKWDSRVQIKEEASVDTKEDFEESDKSFLAMMISKDIMSSQRKTDKPKVDDISKSLGDSAEKHKDGKAKGSSASVTDKGNDENMAKKGVKKEEPFMKPGQKKEEASMDTEEHFEESDKSFLAMMISNDIMSSQRKTGVSHTGSRMKEEKVNEGRSPKKPPSSNKDDNQGERGSNKVSSSLGAILAGLGGCQKRTPESPQLTSQQAAESKNSSSGDSSDKSSNLSGKDQMGKGEQRLQKHPRSDDDCGQMNNEKRKVASSLGAMLSGFGGRKSQASEGRQSSAPQKENAKKPRWSDYPAPDYDRPQKSDPMSLGGTEQRNTLPTNEKPYSRKYTSDTKDQEREKAKVSSHVITDLADLSTCSWGDLAGAGFEWSSLKVQDTYPDASSRNQKLPPQKQKPFNDKDNLKMSDNKCPSENRTSGSQSPSKRRQPLNEENEEQEAYHVEHKKTLGLGALLSGLGNRQSRPSTHNERDKSVPDTSRDKSSGNQKLPPQKQQPFNDKDNLKMSDNKRPLENRTSRSQSPSKRRQPLHEENKEQDTYHVEHKKTLGLGALLSGLGNRQSRPSTHNEGDKSVPDTSRDESSGNQKLPPQKQQPFNDKDNLKMSDNKRPLENRTSRSQSPSKRRQPLHEENKEQDTYHVEHKKTLGLGALLSGLGNRQSRPSTHNEGDKSVPDTSRDESSGNQKLPPQKQQPFNDKDNLKMSDNKRPSENRTSRSQSPSKRRQSLNEKNEEQETYHVEHKKTLGLGALLSGLGNRQSGPSTHNERDKSVPDTFRNESSRNQKLPPQKQQPFNDKDNLKMSDNKRPSENRTSRSQSPSKRRQPLNEVNEEQETYHVEHKKTLGLGALLSGLGNRQSRPSAQNEQDKSGRDSRDQRYNERSNEREQNSSFSGNTNKRSRFSDDNETPPRDQVQKEAAPWAKRSRFSDDTEKPPRDRVQKETAPWVKEEDNVVYVRGFKPKVKPTAVDEENMQKSLAKNMTGEEKAERLKTTSIGSMLAGLANRKFPEPDPQPAIPPLLPQSYYDTWNTDKNSSFGRGRGRSQDRDGDWGRKDSSFGRGRSWGEDRDSSSFGRGRGRGEDRYGGSFGRGRGRGRADDRDGDRRRKDRSSERDSEPENERKGKKKSKEEEEPFDVEKATEKVKAEIQRLAEEHGSGVFSVGFTEKRVLAYMCEICCAQLLPASFDAHVNGMQHLKKKNLWEKKQRILEENAKAKKSTYCGPKSGWVTVDKKAESSSKESSPALGPNGGDQSSKYTGDQSSNYTGDQSFKYTGDQSSKYTSGYGQGGYSTNNQQLGSYGPGYGNMDKGPTAANAIAPVPEVFISASVPPPPPPAPEAPFISTSVPPPPPPAPEAPKPKPAKTGATVSLLQKLDACAVKNDKDLELATSVISALLKSLKEFNHKRGDTRCIEVLTEIDIKFRVLKPKAPLVDKSSSKASESSSSSYKTSSSQEYPAYSSSNSSGSRSSTLNTNVAVSNITTVGANSVSTHGSATGYSDKKYEGYVSQYSTQTSTNPSVPTGYSQHGTKSSFGATETPVTYSAHPDYYGTSYQTQSKVATNARVPKDSYFMGTSGDNTNASFNYYSQPPAPVLSQGGYSATDASKTVTAAPESGHQPPPPPPPPDNKPPPPPPETDTQNYPAQGYHSSYPTATGYYMPPPVSKYTSHQQY